MLQEKLKTETKQQHDQLEQLMFVGDIMTRNLTVEQYQKIVVTNYIVHKQYEHSIHNALTSANASQLGLADRKKTASLSLDLKEARLNSTEIKLTENQLTDTDFTEPYALGAMYVLEGATLGGSVIYKQLKLNENFGNSFNFNYYTVYGSELVNKWQNFLQVLNGLPETDHQQAIDGANMMFEKIAEIAKAQKEEVI